MSAVTPPADRPNRRGDRRATPSWASRTDSAVLFDEIAAGDDDAMAQLHRLLWDHVVGVIEWTVQDPAQAEEVAQEVFIEVWRTATRYRPERGSVLTWVLTLARRRAIDRVRSTDAARRREARYLTEVFGRPYDNVVEEFHAAWEHQQVRLHLDALSDLQQQAIELVYYRGHTSSEAAKLLGVPWATVKTRLRDALIHLRRGLTDDS
ncbi:sigma-70 family RNA polymerase sigma factor [Saccharopolyspora sp. NPDC049357]|uniref:sigma-70 family RNA polymerase sigma factor n=1 Tax=Saccharopolyspora sp. NPDC049357 TaxID=3154507 RepID=UPI00341CAB23